MTPKTEPRIMIEISRDVNSGSDDPNRFPDRQQAFGTEIGYVDLGDRIVVRMGLHGDFLEDIGFAVKIREDFDEMESYVFCHRRFEPNLFDVV